MSELFKLTFTPLKDKKEDIYIYSVYVEYFNKYLIGAKFDKTDENGIGTVAYFTRDFISIVKYFREGYGGESKGVNVMVDENRTIEKHHVDIYLKELEKLREDMENYCREKQKEDEIESFAWNKWLEKETLTATF